MEKMIKKSNFTDDEIYKIMALCQEYFYENSRKDVTKNSIEGRHDMKSIKTFTAEIFVGFREGYSNKIIHSMEEAQEICQTYCNDIGLCVSIKPVFYVYTNGREPGCSITLINYPRFPTTAEKIKETAIALAKIFLEEFNQLRISIVFSDETIMLEGQESTLL